MACQPGQDRWARFRERLKDAGRLPLIGLVIFSSGMAAWLGGWTVWRACEYVYQTYLSESWLS